MLRMKVIPTIFSRLWHLVLPVDQIQHTSGRAQSLLGNLYFIQSIKHFFNAIQSMLTIYKAIMLGSLG